MVLEIIVIIIVFVLGIGVGYLLGYNEGDQEGYCKRWDIGDN